MKEKRAELHVNAIIFVTNNQRVSTRLSAPTFFQRMTENPLTKSSSWSAQWFHDWRLIVRKKSRRERTRESFLAS